MLVCNFFGLPKRASTCSVGLLTWREGNRSEQEIVRIINSRRIFTVLARTG